MLMKTLLTSACALLLSIMTGTVAKSQSFTIDPAASQLSWTGYAEVGSWAPTGSIQVASGHLTMSGAQLRSATLTMAMTTIKHENKQMQEHLRSDAFFDVARFPQATFTLRTLAGTTATGQLTIKGVTRSITFPVGISQTSAGVRIKGKAIVDRTQYGIRYNSSSFFTDLGDQAIRNDFTLTFDLLAKPAGSRNHSHTR